LAALPSANSSSFAEGRFVATTVFIGMGVYAKTIALAGTDDELQAAARFYAMIV